jgi:hypothetical protein
MFYDTEGEHIVMTFSEFKKHFPALARYAIVDPQCSDDTEVTVTEGNPPTVAPSTNTSTAHEPEDKDRQIAELQASLAEANKALLEMLGTNKEKDVTTNINNTVDKANNARRGENPLIAAYRRFNRGRTANV